MDRKNGRGQDASEVPGAAGESFAPGETNASVTDPIGFECRGCGGCCTNTTPFVTPLDAWNLSRRLGVETGRLLQDYLIIREDRITPTSGTVPLLCLDQPGPGLMCRFLDPVSRRCRVYEARPLSCRMFPVGVRHERDSLGRWQDRLVVVTPLPECRGYGRSMNTIGEYLRDAVRPEDIEHSRDYAAFCDEVFSANPGLRDDEDFGDAFLAALFDLDSRPGENFAERFDAGRRLVRSWVEPGTE